MRLASLLLPSRLLKQTMHFGVTNTA
uniref:Uncharacterized protein n=1 Tax=Anguilla anguilla TaxID=7936 RepID=A0A0E9VG81_ANGAN